MPTRDVLKTGIAGLDAILSDGIPRGNVILLEGAVGTGKTTLGVEFVYRGASQFDEPGIIVLFEVSPDKLVRDAANFGWDLPDLERQGRLRIIFTTRQLFRQELQQADSVLLEETRHPHLIRVWNYLPEINREADGEERYRHFNAARQGAFRNAGRSTIEFPLRH